MSAIGLNEYSYYAAIASYKDLESKDKNLPEGTKHLDRQCSLSENGHFPTDIGWKFTRFSDYIEILNGKGMVFLSFCSCINFEYDLYDLFIVNRNIIPVNHEDDVVACKKNIRTEDVVKELIDLFECVIGNNIPVFTKEQEDWINKLIDNRINKMFIISPGGASTDFEFITKMLKEKGIHG
jgi:hypothetical protein